MANSKSEKNCKIEKSVNTTAVIDTELKCEEAIQQIITDCFEYSAVGLECEWNHNGPRIFVPKIDNVLIVSICTPLGYCAIFRMNKFIEVPKCLKDFLEDVRIVKVGVAIAYIVAYLWNDYGIRVGRSIDLRTLAAQSKGALQDILGSRLQPIAEQIYNIYVERDFDNFDQRKWLAAELSTESITFAAKDVREFIEIYKQFCPYLP